LMLLYSPQSVTILPMRSLFFLFCYFYAGHRALHSLPTRRSSYLHLLAKALHGDGFARGRTTGDHDGAIALDHAGGTSAGNVGLGDRKSTRLNSSHVKNSYAVFCLKKKILRYVHNVRRVGDVKQKKKIGKMFDD